MRNVSLTFVSVSVIISDNFLWQLLLLNISLIKIILYMVYYSICNAHALYTDKSVEVFQV